MFAGLPSLPSRHPPGRAETRRPSLHAQRVGDPDLPGCHRLLDVQEELHPPPRPPCLRRIRLLFDPIAAGNAADRARFRSPTRLLLQVLVLLCLMINLKETLSIEYILTT